jgi:3-oxoacid CoA-transferase
MQCAAQVEELVPVGGLDPNNIHVPGAFVHRVVVGPKYEKRIERLTLTQPSGATATASKKKANDEDARKRERIVRRAAKEFKVRALVHACAQHAG